MIVLMLLSECSKLKMTNNVTDISESNMVFKKKEI